MNRYREKLADKIRRGYSCKTLFWVYFFVFGIIGAIILAAYFGNK